MKKTLKTAKIFIYIVLLAYTGALTAAPLKIKSADWSSLSALWEFDDSASPLKATHGRNLEPVGSYKYLTGVDKNDGAVKIGVGSYLRAYNGFNSNAGANRYSVLIDFKVDDLKTLRCFYQTDPENSNDGEVFLNRNGEIGVGDTGYSFYSVIPGQWYRLIISVVNGLKYDYYLDGQLVCQGYAQDINGRFAMDGITLLFADNNGDDGEISVSSAAFFNDALNEDEIRKLSGYGHIIDTDKPSPTTITPYLQGAAQNSIYVCWHTETNNTNAFVRYGLNRDLNKRSPSAILEAINKRNWRSVKIEELEPDTEYYYRVVNGNDSTEIYSFRTFPKAKETNKHVVFAAISDTQMDSELSTRIVSKMKAKLIEKYGENYNRRVNFVMHCGDLVQNGAKTYVYYDEFFRPFSQISSALPIMVSPGNHDIDSRPFYAYMKNGDYETKAYPFNSRYYEKWYSFDVANCRFISMNTNYPYDNGEQLNWIESKLISAENDNAIDFVFLYCHHPAYSETCPEGVSEFVRNDLMKVLKKYSKVEILFTGHSHRFELGSALSASGNEFAHDFRTMIIGGGAGSGLDRWRAYSDQLDYGFVQKSFDRYHFNIVDVDMAAQSYTVETYSLGIPEKPSDNELISVWSRNRIQPPPLAPRNIISESAASINISPFTGVGSLMSSQFQISASPIDYSLPVIDTIRDLEDFYYDTGAPNYEPINKNKGINLSKLDISEFNLIPGQAYFFRARYRDDNMKWSAWSQSTPLNSNALGVASLDDFNAICYPNPSDDYCNIAFGARLGDEYAIKISNQFGEIVREIFGLADSAEIRLKIETAELSSGAYIATIKCGARQTAIRIVKVK
jgi:predicted phosphodiesterase